MHKYIIALILLIFIYSCSRKNTPARTDSITTTVTSGSASPKKTDSVVVARKKTVTPKKKDIIPPSIVVNDNAAKKAVDGRLYYDLLGNRYWKNYKDGKYYLFSQKMYDNPAFKPPK